MSRIALGSAAILAASCAQAEVAKPVPAAAVSYQADIVPLFESQCATCHLTGDEAGTISLVGDVAIGFLVARTSQEAPSIMRVVAGNPDASYLVMKLEGTHIAHGGSGAQMPFGAPPLTPPQIGKIRQWIAAGAKP